MKKLMLLVMSLVLVALCAGVGLAAENECETDADCPNGFACVESEVGVKDVPTTSVDFGEGTDSDSGDEGSEDEAAPVEEPPAETFKYCDAKRCEADADCDGGTVCIVIEVEDCANFAVVGSSSTPASGSGSGGSADGEDSPPEPVDPDDTGDDIPDVEEECETIALPGFCGPQWLAPCEVDADCGGANLTCVEAESCWSTGSTGSDSSAGFAPDPGSSGDSEEGSGSDPDPSVPVEEDGDEGDDDEDLDEKEVNCEGTGYFYCEMDEIACTDSAECPADWDCLENPSAGVAVSVSVSRDVPCDVDEEGNEDCPDAVDEPETTTEISSLCFPPGYEDYANWGGPDSVGGMAMSEDAARGGGVGPGDPNAGGTGEGEAAPPSSSSSSDDGGCAGGPQPLSAAWITLALLALALRRREQVQA